MDKIASIAIVVLLVLGVVFISVDAAKAQEISKTIITIPDEELKLNLPPTTIVFDFYMADEHRGEVLITYTDDSATFHDPEGMLEMLPETNNIEAVLGLINNGEMPSLSNRIESVGDITIDPSTFEVRLNLEADVLNAKRISIIKDNVEPSSSLALLNNLRVVATNQFNGDGFDGTFSNHHALSYGHNRLEWQGSYAKDGGYDIRSFLIANEQDEMLSRVGMMQTNGLQFASSQDILAMSVGSNIDTLFGDSTLTGDDVTVFIPSRARIKVFADGRMIYTEILDFGLQSLNTSSFPAGSYDLEIEIIEEATGRTTFDSQFFTKTTRLVPFDKPDWLVKLGFARDELNPNTAEPIWEAVYRERVNSNWELGGALLGGKGLNIFEPQARMYWRNLEFRGNLSFTDKGDVASSLFGQILTDNFGNLTTQMRRTIRGHSVVPNLRSDEFNPLSSKIDILTGSWNRSFGKLQLTLRGTKSKNSGNTAYSWGPSIRYPILAGLEQRVELQADYTRSNIANDVYGVFLTYQYNPKDSNWLGSTRVSHRDGSTKQTGAVTQIEYDNRESVQNNGTEVIFTNTTSSSDGEVFIGNDVSLTHTTQNFSTKITGTHANRGGETSKSLGISANTTFAIDGKENLFVGSSLGKGTVIVNLKGSAKGEVMLVKNGHQTMGKGKVGERITISVQPFKTYNLTIEPESEDSLVSYNSTPIPFKLINKGVKIVEFDVSKVLLVFGRMIDGNGKPLSWQRIKGATSSVLTDQLGNFQAEVAENNVMFVNNRQYKCTAAIPQMVIDGIFSYVGDVLCL